MPHRPTRDWDEDDWDEEAPPDDEERTERCPHCGKEVHEEAQMCPYCENWITEEEDMPTQKPLWIVLTTLVCLLIVLLWIFRL